MLGSPPVDGLMSLDGGFRLGRFGIEGLASCAFGGTGELIDLVAEASILARLFEASREERSMFCCCVFGGGMLCTGCGVEIGAKGGWSGGINGGACCCNRLDNCDSAPGGITDWPFSAISGCRTGKFGCVDVRSKVT